MATQAGTSKRQHVDVEENYEASLFATPSSVYGITLPTEITGFAKKCCEEFKKLHKSYEKSKAQLLKLTQLKQEGLIPNSLKMSSPRIQIAHMGAQALLSSSLAELTEKYRAACFDAYLQAFTTAVEDEEKSLTSYCESFEGKLTDILAPLEEVTLSGSFESSALTAYWKDRLSSEFRNLSNSYKCATHWKNTATKAAFVQREKAMDAAMQEADSLPKEQTIAELVKAEVAKQLKQQKQPQQNKPKASPAVQKSQPKKSIQKVTWLSNAQQGKIKEKSTSRSKGHNNASGSKSDAPKNGQQQRGRTTSRSAGPIFSARRSRSAQKYGSKSRPQSAPSQNLKKAYVPPHHRDKGKSVAGPSSGFQS